VADLNLMLFFLFDHILYLGKIGLIKQDYLRMKADYLSNLFWLGECIFTIIADCIDIHLLQKKLHKEAANEKDKNFFGVNHEITAKTDAAIVDILRSIIDIPIALHFMNDKFLTPGYVGILGVITSYLGCYQNWPASK